MNLSSTIRSIIHPSAGTVLFCLFFIGCGTQLRAPLCDPNEVSFPAGAEGRYRVTVVGESLRFSGAYADLTEVEFNVRNEESQIEIEVHGKGSSPKELRNKLAAAAVTRGKRASTARIAEDGVVVDLPFPVAVCKIGSAYYSQVRAENGTYDIARFDLSPTGITTVALSFDPDSLIKHGFNVVYLPQLHAIEMGNNVYPKPEKVKVVVDNVGLNTERREELISLAKPWPLGVVYSRITPSSMNRDRRGYTSFTMVFPKK